MRDRVKAAMHYYFLHTNRLALLLIVNQSPKQNNTGPTHIATKCYRPIDRNWSSRLKVRVKNTNENPKQKLQTKTSDKKKATRFRAALSI